MPSPLTLPTALRRRHWLAGAALLPLASQARPAAKRVLIVATNTGRVGPHTSGTYLVELAYPYRRLRDAGWAVDVVTPAGGAAAVYHAGATPPALAAIVADPGFQQAHQQTLAAEAIEPARYAAVYYPGGHGQYFDVLSDERIACATEQIHAQGGWVSSAGHGAASLVHLRAGAHYLVRGKLMTCFPAWAERAFMDRSDYGERLPFDMELLLRRRGADLRVCRRETRGDESLIRVLDRPGRFITGAFAADAGWVAQQLVEQLAAA